MIQKQKTKSRKLFYLECQSLQACDGVREQIQKTLTPYNPIWHQNTRDERQSLPLGETRTGLIYDIWSGFHPDTFAALSGCVTGGGWVMLLGPPLAKLHLFQDPNYDKISLWPRICPAQTHYLRLVQTGLDQLIKQSHLELITSSSPEVLSQTLHELVASSRQIQQHLQSPFETASPDTPSQVTPTIEQTVIIDKVTQAVLYNQKQWFTVFANRGNGKTTAIHLLVQHLISVWCESKYTDENTETSQNKKSPQLQISFVTHRNLYRKHLNQWIEQISSTLPSSLTLLTTTLNVLENGKLESDNSGLEKKRHLIIIDECASYNIKNLENALQPLQQTSSIVLLSSSLDGYEGSAKSLHHLQSPIPLTHLILTQPVRWSNEDPLASWIKSFFYAETDLPDPAASNPASKLERDVRVTPFNPSRQEKCTEWMQLMSMAHYRTRPSDLRIMLDAPGQEFWCIEHAGHIVAGLWLSHEGPIPEYLHQPILNRQRRLKGHLAPQYAALHGIPGALEKRWIRIVRIAVLPAFQRHGLGSKLVKFCKDTHIDKHLAVSFRPSDKVAKFWISLGMKELRPGFFWFKECLATARISI